MSGSTESNLKLGDHLGEDDPFAHLHKMSTTAGLGSGDYVAISGTAVGCIMLGLCSGLVLFDNLIFLIFPVLGVVAGILAWRQISRSNATQTGHAVATIGMLLSIGFGGFYSVQRVYAGFQHRADQDQVVSQLHKMGQLLHDGHYDSAYALCDDDFKKKVSEKDFSNFWENNFTNNKYLGPVLKMDWNQLLDFEVDPLDESSSAKGTMLLYYSVRPNQPLRSSMVFRKIGDAWLIDALPDLFSPKPADDKKKPSAAK